MLRALTDAVSRAVGALQLELGLHAAPDDGGGGDFLRRLRAHGLRGITDCRLTTNRSTMVSFRGASLRVHADFVRAPDHVLRAIVTFVNGRGRARRDARRVIVAFPVDRDPARPRRREGQHPDDAPLALRLQQAHATFNRERFGGALHPIAVRVSRRMRSRLGHYSPAGSDGCPAEISISRRHIRRHGWDDALDTLLHEMVHQWQDEQGLKLAHGAEFRRKAGEVGASPRARRAIAS